MPIFGDESCAIVPVSPTESGDVIDDDDGDADHPVPQLLTPTAQLEVIVKYPTFFP
ncbi:Hypothetical protein, putative [Bodo saltans]|uniref:Uncharacterized protein n=1 Tax=Bodo saltans TaxID=75058 RepID=A0A0S4JF62_BODSA|nr:Hypothetical protein, putative [Bodo saltans]|eukprot:CUG89103.1 Hypothetical protein, putative [Bodo saltans]